MIAYINNVQRRTGPKAWKENKMEIDKQNITKIERMIDNLIHGSACDTICDLRNSAAEYRQVATDYAIVLKELGIRDYAKEENMPTAQLAIIAKINRKIAELQKDKDFMKELMFVIK